MVFWWKLSRLLWGLSMLGCLSETPLLWCRQHGEQTEVSVQFYDCSVRDGYKLFSKDSMGRPGQGLVPCEREAGVHGAVPGDGCPCTGSLLQISWSHSSTRAMQHWSAIMTTSQRGQPTRKSVLLPLVLTNNKDAQRWGSQRQPGLQ